MFKPNKITKSLALIASVLAISLSLGYFVSAWAEPTAPPPVDNVSTPLNSGNTNQSKAGGLILNTGGAVNGLIVQSGNVGIGTTSPNSALDIAGFLTMRETTAPPVSTLGQGRIYIDSTTKDIKVSINGQPYVSLSCGAISTPPSQVTGLTATAGNTQVVLNWTTPANGGSAITNYKIYRSTPTNGSYSLLTTLGNVLTYTNTGLTNGTTYYYKVSAVNAIGEGSQSSEASATPYSFTCGSSTITYGAKTYNTVGIGTQCWMATNLEYDNGCTTKTWVNNIDVGWCGYYTGGPFANEGLLYQWSVAMNGSASCNGTGASQPACTTPVQGICPSGWHLPSHYEWTLLEKNVGSNPGAFPYNETTFGYLGTDEGTNLKTGGSSGFNGIFAGYRDTAGSSSYRGTITYLWSSTESGSTAWDRALYSGYATVGRIYLNKAFGFSVRCLKN